MTECIFCRIAEHKEKADIVWEDGVSICFLPKKAEVYGHCLIIPKKHYSDIFEIETENLIHIFKMVKKISLMLRDKIGADGVNILHASGKAAGQSIGHFHLHLLPRFDCDGVDAWPLMEEVCFDREEYIERMKSDD